MSRLKGEVPFTVELEEGEQEFVLLLDWNALCDLEDELPGIIKGDVDLESPKAVRLVFWAGLQARHEIDKREAGTIITQLGPNRVAELITEAFAASFGEAGKSTGNPRKTSASRKS